MEWHPATSIQTFLHGCYKYYKYGTQTQAEWLRTQQLWIHVSALIGKATCSEATYLSAQLSKASYMTRGCH